MTEIQSEEFPGGWKFTVFCYRSSDAQALPNDESFCNRLEGGAGSAISLFLCGSVANF
jgi:hypothetical protein